MRAFHAIKLLYLAPRQKGHRRKTRGTIKVQNATTYQTTSSLVFFRFCCFSNDMWAGNNNNNNNNIYLLQLGCYPVAVVILHANKT